MLMYVCVFIVYVHINLSYGMPLM